MYFLGVSVFLMWTGAMGPWGDGAAEVIVLQPPPLPPPPSWPVFNTPPPPILRLRACRRRKLCRRREIYTRTMPGIQSQTYSCLWCRELHISTIAYVKLRKKRRAGVRDTIVKQFTHDVVTVHSTLLDNCWRISLYVTEDATYIAKIYVTYSFVK